MPPTPLNEADQFADVHDFWSETAPSAAARMAFYVEEYQREDGLVLELGIGTGRIAITAAKRGKHLVGVDPSLRMVEYCRRKARDAGVEGMITLVRAGLEDFRSEPPAQLIAMTTQAIGRAVTFDDKRTCLKNVHAQLAPRGRLIFDHFVVEEQVERVRSGLLQYRGLRVDPISGRGSVLWTTNACDFDRQQMEIVAVLEDLAPDRTVDQRIFRRLQSSWILPTQARFLLEETGFEVEACYGDFDRRAFAPGSPHQIWIARKR